MLNPYWVLHMSNSSTGFLKRQSRKNHRTDPNSLTTESLDFAGGSGLHCLFLSITMKKLWPRENMYSDAEVNLQMCWWHAFGPELLAKKMHMLWLIKLTAFWDRDGICRVIDQCWIMQNLGYQAIMQINSIYLIRLENTWISSWQF